MALTRNLLLLLLLLSERLNREGLEAWCLLIHLAR
jgi:hypothetical protein